jgi:hypothetical protein
MLLTPAHKGNSRNVRERTPSPPPLRTTMPTPTQQSATTNHGQKNVS